MVPNSPDQTALSAAGPTARSIWLVSAVKPDQDRSVTGSRNTSARTPKSYSRAPAIAVTAAPPISSVTDPSSSASGGTPNDTAFIGVAISRPRALAPWARRTTSAAM